MRFGYDNKLETAIVTSSDRYSATFDIANVYDRRLAKKWRSAPITDLMTYGDCEETTSPTLDGGTFGLANATWARSAVEKYEGSYSWLFTKTSAGGAGDAENYLTDNININDLHNLIAGRTYCLALYLFTDVATLTNAKIIVQEYHTAAWHDILTLEATQASTWQEKKGSFTLNVLTTGVTIKMFIDTNEAVGKLIYLDDIRFYLENRIFIDTTTALNPTVTFIAGHNLSASATVKLQGNAAAEWTSPTISEPIIFDTKIMLKFISAAPLLHWSILFDDEDNTDGYIEIGYAFIGNYLQATKGAARVFGEKPDDKSTVMEGSTGQILGAVGVKINEWDINIPWWTDTMKTDFETMYEVIGNYRPFCFILDENNLSYFKAKYVRIKAYDFTHIMTLNKWAAKLTIREAK